MRLPLSEPTDTEFRNRNTDPPISYRDLTNPDLSLLAPILTPCPLTEEGRTDYAHRVSTRITTLPTHLLAKHPRLSTFCPLHKPLNPLPIIALFAAIQRQVEHVLKAKSSRSSEYLQALQPDLLEDLAAIWLSPSDFFVRFSRFPNPSTATYIPQICAACRLAALARNLQVLFLLGALTLARLRVSSWKRSKRMVWFEQCIHVSTLAGNWGFRPEVLVAEMWALGMRLKRLQKGEVGEMLEVRESVFGFVRQARGVGLKDERLNRTS